MKTDEEIWNTKAEDMSKEDLARWAELYACSPCPTCGKRGEDCKNLLIESLRKTTLLFHCKGCQIIFGSYQVGDTGDEE